MAAIARALQRTMQSYAEANAQHPLLVKALTSGVMFGAGDCIAQTLVPPPKGDPQVYDWRRTLAFASFGLLLAGPTFHVWYGRLDHLPKAIARVRNAATLRAPAGAVTATTAGPSGGSLLAARMSLLRQPASPAEVAAVPTRYVIATKVACDQLIFAPVFLPVFVFYTGAFRGGSVADSAATLRQTFWPTYRMDWCVWPAAQTLNFTFVPVPLQPLMVNVVSLGWNTFLSWFIGGKQQS
ncbi:hypothetical protein H696_00853 [Fonticula alba]|uniref:Protein Mpv17 n=1 Tax=Fonticula alba TaxID=691883 RepID=A0A058ZIG6_FONAL|nr:hypothetical protein H696_00853 [Fonticula alba]KCV73312.1 hypothetical protein H696_00853 [Fonticula alba]|eukprot:XP_009493013.1 hypothetical protein H696_00853 [Fonticula alba]